MKKIQSEPDIKEPFFISAIFRWLLMIPAAIIGYIAAYTITFWISSFTLGMFTTVPELAVIPAAGVGGVSFVLVGVALAPLYRGFVSIALLGIHAAFLSLSIVLFSHSYIETRTLWQILVEGVSGFVGAGCGLYFVINTLGWSRLTNISKLWRKFRV